MFDENSSLVNLSLKAAYGAVGGEGRRGRWLGGWLRLNTHTHTLTHARTHTHTYTRARPHTHTHTHTFTIKMKKEKNFLNQIQILLFKLLRKVSFFF